MPKIKTADCPILPAHMQGQKPEIPVPHLLDEDIDLALDYMHQRGAFDMDPPATKYTRRIAVATFLKMEQGTPVDEALHPWESYNPTQPR